MGTTYTQSGCSFEQTSNTTALEDVARELPRAAEARRRAAAERGEWTANPPQWSAGVEDAVRAALASAGFHRDLVDLAMRPWAGEAQVREIIVRRALGAGLENRGYDTVRYGWIDDYRGAAIVSAFGRRWSVSGVPVSGDAQTAYQGGVLIVPAPTT